MHQQNKQFLVFALCTALLGPAVAAAQEDGPPRGTWYLALDAEPFGLPEGMSLAGLASFHKNKSFTVIDGGDFGGAPFETVHTAQMGSWRRRNGKIEAVSLFIQADGKTGAVQSWQKVHFVLEPAGPNRLVGSVNVFELTCDGPAPFPVFGCPDPIASAADFTPLPPFDIPITLRRLPPRKDVP